MPIIAPIRHPDFPSRYIPPREVDVWLPPGYPAGRAHYPALYMHDGQNLFESIIPPGKTPWRVDEALAALVDSGEARAAIIVGVWNSGERWREYAPEKPMARVKDLAARARFMERAGGISYSDRYLAFLVDELKPFIDAQYKTLPGRADTVVMGSSMGGLISLYAISEYPEVFGGAGCVSTHWPAGGTALVDAMADGLPHPANHRLYFDYGTETLDATYEPFQLRMDARLTAAGYARGDNWLTMKFDGAAHHEESWSKRVDLPLRFLLGP